MPRDVDERAATEDAADKNVRIRPVDHAAFEEIQKSLPISNKDLITAMRILWQQSSARARAEALEKIAAADKVPA